MGETTTNKKLNILLVIKDAEFYRELLDDPSSNKFEIHYADSAKTALDYLKMGQSYFHCIFVNPKLTADVEIGLLKECHEERTGIPIYLILNDMKELGQEINPQDAGINGTIANKNELIAVTRMIEQGLGKFDAEAAMRLGRETPDPEEGEEGQMLVPVNAANFLSGSQSFFDLFVRIREGKFIKILNARDNFETDRLEHYREKGLTHFWIKKAAQKYYIDFCAKLATKIINNKSVSDDVKVKMTLNQGQEVMGFLARNGLDEEGLHFAANYSENITLLVRRMATNSKAIQNLMKNVAAFEHSAGTAMICGLMAKHSQLDGSLALNTLGLSASLHDIGLFRDKTSYDSMSDKMEVMIMDETDIELELARDTLPLTRKKELLKIYHDHPQKGADICAKMTDIDPDVVQIIAHHHERTDGKGFPNKLSGPAINPLAQILGVADEFSKLIRKIYLGKAQREELTLFPSRLSGFSMKTVKIWEALFLKK